MFRFFFFWFCLFCFAEIAKMENFSVFMYRTLLKTNEYLSAKRMGIVSNIKTNVFNELEALQMIPVVIKELKAHKLSDFDKKLLHTTYGDLWFLILKESTRSSMEDINPLLKSLIQAHEFPNNRPIKSLNDIETNTVNKVYHSNHNDHIPLGLLKLRMNADMAPAQRLLKVAAILIRESLIKKKGSTLIKQIQRNGKQLSRRKNHSFKKQLTIRNNAGIKSRNQMKKTLKTAPNVRSKRSLKRKDAEINKKLRAIIDPISVSESEDFDYDMYDDEVSNVKNENAAQPENQKNQAQQLKREQQAKQLSFIKGEDYKDYAFDTTDTDHFSEEEDLLSSFYGVKRRSAYDDYDYSSFSDLMHLAAKNAFRSQQENRYVQRLHDDYLNDEDDYRLKNKNNKYDDEDDDDEDGFYDDYTT